MKVYLDGRQVWPGWRKGITLATHLRSYGAAETLLRLKTDSPDNAGELAELISAAIAEMKETAMRQARHRISGKSNWRHEGTPD